MSRKTRKLIWSAPLVAVLAVVGALAAFATLSPGGVLAQDAMMGPPTGLTATVNSQTQITLNWNAPASGSVSTYRVDVSEDGDVWEELVDSDGFDSDNIPVVVLGNTAQYKHTGLDAETTYHYRVFGVFTSGGEGEPAAPVMATTRPAKAPAAPTGLVESVGTPPTQTEITIVWTVPAGTATGGSDVTGFKIEASEDGGRWRTLEENRAASATDSDGTATGTQNEYTHSKLLASTMWSYRVSAINEAGTGEASDTVESTTAAGVVPDAVSSMYSQGTSSSGLLVWLAPDDPPGAPITSYKIERKAEYDNPATTDVDESAATQWEEIGTTRGDTSRTVGKSTTGYVDSGDDEVAWQYRVFAVNSVGTSAAPGTVLTASPPDAALRSSVTGLRATVLSQTQIKLDWTAARLPTGATVNHNILVSKDGRSWKSSANDADTTTTYTHGSATPATNAALKAGETWYYRIIPSSPTGQHPWSSMVQATTRAPRAPGAPTALTAAPNGASQIDLTWVAPVAGMLYGSSITGYQVERSEDQIDWVTAAETGSTAPVADTPYMDKGLAPGTEYYYRVRARTAGGAGKASEIMNATTTGADFLDSPSGLVAIAKGSSQVDLYWLTPGDPGGAPVTGYKIEYSTDGGSNWMALNANTMSRTTMASHMGLMAETEYTYRVSAINSEETSAPSPDDSATTGMPSVPGMPTSVSAMADSDTEITVSWMAPDDVGASNITGYMVQRAYMMSGGTMSAWMNTSCSGTAMSCMDTGLMPETTYYYRVRAMNAEGYGEYTDGMATATTEATPAELQAPTNVRVNPVGSGLVNVGWDPAPGAAGYTIIAVNIADPTEAPTESVNNPNAVAGQIGNLTVGEDYNIYVASFGTELDFAMDFTEKKRVTVE